MLCGMDLLNLCPKIPAQVTLSVIEVYCERVRDLLNPEKDNLQVSFPGKLSTVWS